MTTWAVKRLFVLAIALSAASLTVPATAADYPNKPIRLIVPYAPGGATDIVARALSKEFQVRTGQPLVVDNRGGAGGILAAELAAHAPADGYTIFFGATGPLAIGPAVYGKVEFDTRKDFAPITLLANTPYVLVVNPALPANSVAELIALLKAKPGQLNYASSGTGGPDHLGSEIFAQMTGTKSVHVPYKGSGPALADLVAGQVQYQLVSPVPSMPLVKSGHLRVLAVTGSSRSPAMPDLPTVAETVPGFDVTPWYGLLAPAGTPDAVIQFIYQEVADIIAKPEMRQYMLDQGLEPKTMKPAEFGAFLDREVDKWSDVVRRAKVTALE